MNKKVTPITMIIGRIIFLMIKLLKWIHWLLLFLWTYKGSEDAKIFFVPYVSRKNRASQINRSTPGHLELIVLPLLVSTISLGCMSPLERTDDSNKVLVEYSSPEDYRGVAGTVKVTYS